VSDLKLGNRCGVLTGIEESVFAVLAVTAQPWITATKR
jgi:hypothetical protein